MAFAAVVVADSYQCSASHDNNNNTNNMRMSCLAFGNELATPIDKQEVFS